MATAISSKICFLKTENHQKKRQGKWNRTETEIVSQHFFDPKTIRKRTVCLLKPPKNKKEITVYFLMFWIALQIPVGEAFEDASSDNSGTETSQEQIDQSNLPNSNHTSTPFPVTHHSDSLHYREREENTSQEYVYLTQDREARLQNNKPTKRKEESNLSALLANNRQLKANYRNAEFLIKRLKEHAPDKLNRDSDQSLTSSSNSVSFQKLKEFQLLYEANAINLNRKLSKELGAAALYDNSQPGFLKEEYFKIATYLLRLQDQLILHALAKKFHGGTCADQTSFVVVEALRKGYDIELIELTDINNPDVNTHVFAAYGKYFNGLLEDPTTWRESAIIIDFWAYNDLITIAELKKHPENFKMYFDNNWIWKSTLYSKKLPKSLMGKYYNDYQQIRNYFSFCQKKITSMLTLDFILPITEVNTQI